MPNPASPVNPPGIHGKDGLLCLSLTASPVPTTFTALTGVTDVSLDMSTDMVETTALGSANKTYVKGLKDIKMTFSAVWDSLDDILFEAAEQTAPVYVAYFPTKDNAANWQGPAFLDISIKSGVTAAVTVDGNITAAAAWSRTAVGPAPA